jgi:hypothetical protein
MGHGVALSGDGKTMLVGAPFRSAGGAKSAGAGEIYTYGGGIWHGPVEVDLGKHGDGQLGFAVALSANGKVGLMSAPGRGNGGAVEVFTLQNGSWRHTAELSMGNANLPVNFALGISVALNAAGTMALVGAPGRTINGQLAAGAAELFTSSHGSWSGPTELSLGKKAAQSDALGSGTTLSASGSTALLGVPGRTVGKYNTGAGEVFSIR